MNAFAKAATKPAPTLESMTIAWLMAKRMEEEAKAERVSIEALIAAELPLAEGNEGTHSVQVADYKIAVKYGVTRKVDSEKLQAMWQDLVPQAQSAFRWKADLALPKLRALQELLPAQYAKLADVIETKPSKPSVTIETVTKEAA